MILVISQDHPISERGLVSGRTCRGAFSGARKGPSGDCSVFRLEQNGTIMHAEAKYVRPYHAVMNSAMIAGYDFLVAVSTFSAAACGMCSSRNASLIQCDPLQHFSCIGLGHVCMPWSNSPTIAAVHRHMHDTWLQSQLDALVRMPQHPLQAS